MNRKRSSNPRASQAKNDPRRWSRLVVDGPKQTPSRAMLRAVGFKDADFKKPQIGIASTWANLTPCNMHINDLAKEAEAGANVAGGKGVLFNTITVSDGISMGTPGMRYSLVSREIIADSIEAVTGAGAIAEIESGDAVVRELAGLLRGTRDDLAAKVRDALDRIRQLEKDNRGLRDKLASGQGTDLAAGAVDVGGVKVLATVVEGADAGALRTAVDGLKDRLKAAIIVLASTSADGKVTLVAGVTSAETARLKAGELVGHVASQVGGRGGGRADFAQAGGTDASRLPEALASVVPYVRGKWGL